uniref:hypothetical protein n=1 Tax=Pseudactinotalea sp. TaxID=1926260 RepID=UPI003B3A4379
MTDVEEFDLVEHSPPPTPVGQTRPRRSAPWSWAALAAVLVLAGVASAPDRPYPSIGVGTAQGTSAAVLELDLTVPAVPAWSTEIELATPIPVLRPVGDVVIVLDEVVTGYDPATGEPLWRHDAVGETCAVTSQVVCTARDGVGLITSIDPASGETVTLTIPEAEYAIAVDGGLVVAMDVDRGHIM